MHNAREKITKNYKFQVVKCTKHSGGKWAIFMESKGPLDERQEIYYDIYVG